MAPTTSTTGQQASTGPETPTAPEPFEIEWDFEANYCASDTETATYDLVHEIADEHPDIAALIKHQTQGLESDAAHELLAGYASDLEAMLDDAEIDDEDEDSARTLLYELQQAAERLTWCTDSCCCASDAYHGWGQDWLNSMLGELGDQLWAVTRPAWRGHDEPQADIDDALNIDTVFASTKCDAWVTTNLKWDGTSLTASFSIYRSGSTLVTLTPLTAEQKEVHREWSDASYYDDIAARIVAADAHALDAAVELWTSAEDPEQTFGEFEKLLETLTAMPADERGRLDVAVIERLAPTWSASMSSMLTISLDLAAAPITAFAA